MFRPQLEVLVERLKNKLPLLLSPSGVVPSTTAAPGGAELGETREESGSDTDSDEGEWWGRRVYC